MSKSKYDVQEMIRLREEGCTIRDIQDRLQIPSTSIIQHHLNRSDVIVFNRKELEAEILKLRKENRAMSTKIERLKKILGT